MPNKAMNYFNKAKGFLRAQNYSEEIVRGGWQTMAIVLARHAECEGLNLNNRNNIFYLIDLIERKYHFKGQKLPFKKVSDVDGWITPRYSHQIQPPKKSSVEKFATNTLVQIENLIATITLLSDRSKFPLVTNNDLSVIQIEALKEISLKVKLLINHFKG